MRAILTFHSIDPSGSVISYDQRLFDRLLSYLRHADIPICDLDTLLGDQTQPGIAITFDDGMKSVYREALPVLKNYGARAHLFLTTGAIGRDQLWPQDSAFVPPFEMLDWDEVEALHDAGILIESHTHSHPDMRTLSQEQVVVECIEADETINKWLGRRPCYFAYPFGYHNRAARDYARGRYTGAVTTELRYLGDRDDPAALPRLDAFYLRSAVGVRYLDSSVMRIYLALRNKLRTLKGSQCVADQD